MLEKSSTNQLLPTPSLPPRLGRLPIELLIRISLLLELPSARAFALVARAFVSPANERIRRHVNLTLHPYYGEVPWVGPDARLEDYCVDGQQCEYYPTRSELADEVSWEKHLSVEWHAEGMKERVNLLLAEEGGSKLRLTQSLRVIPREGIAVDVMRVLAVVGPNLQGLEFGSPPEHLDPVVDWCPWRSGGLEHQLIKSTLPFPSLTHVKLCRGSLGCYGFIPLLCSRAVNIVELDIEIDQFLLGRDRDLHTYALPDLLERPTRIRRLRLAYEPHRSGGNPIPTLVSLLEHAPLMQQLAIECRSKDGDRFLSHTLQVIASYRWLRDLRFPRVSGIYQPFAQRWEAALATTPLRRMVLSAARFDDYRYQHWPSHSNMQVLCFDPYGDPIPILAIKPSLAFGLHRIPHLHTLHYDEDGSNGRGLDTFTHLDRIASSRSATILVRSFRRGNGELLRLRLLSYWREVSDVLRPPGLVRPCEDDQESGDRRTVVYYESGQHRMKVYERRTEPLVRYLTDFDGLVVPLEVIREMKRVERVTKEMSEGRGVEVGAEAWKVLTDWRDGVMAAKEALGAEGTEPKL